MGVLPAGLTSIVHNQDGDGTGGEDPDDVYDAMFYIGEPALQFDGVDDYVEVPNTGGLFNLGCAQ